MDELEYESLIQWSCRQCYYNGMLSHARQACESYPSNDRLKILLALALHLTNQEREALKEVSGIIIHGEFSLPTLLVQSLIHKSSGNVDRTAVAQIDAKIREDRRKASPSALSLAAMILLLIRRPEKAKEYADRAFKQDSSDSNVLISKGWTDLYLNAQSTFGRSTNFFETVLKSNSKHLNALLGCAKFKEYHDDHLGAIAILNALIVRYPKYSFPLVEKMLNQLAMKEWEQVLETANRIQSIDNNSLDAMKAKTFLALCRDGDYSEGVKYIQQLFRNMVIIETKNVDLVNDNIQLFSRISGRDKELLTELFRITEKMAHQNTQSGELMVELGNLCILLGKVKDAERWYQNTVRIDESSFTALTGLANCQLLDTSPTAKELASQQVDFLMELQSHSPTPEILFMSAKLSNTNPNKALKNLDAAATILGKNCEGLPYGYEYLKKLNCDLCLEIVNEHLLHSPGGASSDLEMSPKVNNKSDLNNPCLAILEKITEACPGLGNALLMLGKIKMQNGDYEGALTSLKKLLDIVEPTNATGHLLMAQILVHRGQYQLASQTLEVGLSYNFKVRDNPNYHMILGIIAKENGDLEACIQNFRTAMTFAGMKNTDKNTVPISISISDRATLFTELIFAYIKMRNFREALLLIEEAELKLKATAEEGRLIIAKAELNLEMGDIDKALNLLSKVLPGEPYYLQAHIKLAEIHLKYRKDRDAFAKCFRDLVENCPGSETYSMLGDAYIAIQEPERAIEAYEQSLRSNASDKNLARKMGKALVKTHQYEKAIEYYERIIKQKEFGDLKLDMAELFMKLKMYEKAETRLLQELRIGSSGSDPQDLEIRGKQLLLLAKVRERSGNIKGALSTLKDAKDNQNKYALRAATSSDTAIRKQTLTQICLYIADHATSLREFDQAIDYYKEALSYKPNDITALLSLAKLYMQVNNLDKCEQTCMTLLKADSNNEAASVMMADLAFRKVDFETAAVYFRQLLLQRPTYWTALARLIEVSRRTGNMDDLEEWVSRAEKSMDPLKQEAGYYYCNGLLNWRIGKLNSALRNFNAARRDPEWGQQAIYNMIEICLDPDDDSPLLNEAFNDEDEEYEDARTMALKTAQRLLKELFPTGSPHESLTHRLLGNFFLLATKQKYNIEKALHDCTSMASDDSLRDHVGPALGLAMAHILLKQTPRARNHLKRVSKNVWTFEDAEYLERCWLLLADIYVQSNKYDLAKELLRRALQHNATCIRAHELSGFIAEKEQNYREAAARYAQAWKFGGKSKLSMGCKLAYCNLKSKLYADAVDACNEVLKQSPDYPRIKKDILEKAINNLRT